MAIKLATARRTSSIRTRVITRREVLRGAGGFTLGLPFLPSLVPGRAFGADPVPARRPCFLALTSNHGGLTESALYPADATLTESGDLYPGHVIRRGALVARIEGADTVISEVLRAPSNRLTPKRVASISILRGLDIPYYISHHTGGHLGNYARSDGNTDTSIAMPTIDHLMAWSPSFYPQLSGIRERSMVQDYIHARISWGWSNPAARTGTIQGMRNAGSPAELFRKIFVPGTTPTTPPAEVRKPIIDRVIANYRSLRQSDRRLSADDRQRLDDHIGRLDELQRRVNAMAPVAPGAACQDRQAPPTTNGQPATVKAMLDVYASAFACGTSRIGVLGVNESEWVSYAGSWHQDHAHLWNSSGQPKLREANRRLFQDVFLHAIEALDVHRGGGGTLLDDTLVAWSNEAGEETHDTRSLPLLIAGSAAGFLKTGQYIDYRNRTTKVGRGPAGLLWTQWLATALQAMRVPPSEWQTIPNNGAAGYGLPRVSGGYAAAYASGVRDKASEILPYLRA